MARLIDSELNFEIKAWTNQTTALAKREMKKLNIASGPGVNSLRGKVYSDKFGDASHIGFGMKKHMIFVHKGVGRGYPIDKAKKIAAPGTKTRIEKPFLNPILDAQVPKLADTVQKHIADAAVRSFDIK
jgi:hypothetical protein